VTHVTATTHRQSQLYTGQTDKRAILMNDTSETKHRCLPPSISDGASQRTCYDVMRSNDQRQTINVSLLTRWLIEKFRRREVPYSVCRLTHDWAEQQLTNGSDGYKTERLLASENNGNKHLTFIIYHQECRAIVVQKFLSVVSRENYFYNSILKDKIYVNQFHL